MNWDHVKATLKGLWKSWTAWFAASLAAAPLALPMVQDNFKTFAPYIPDALESHLMQAIALIIVILRIKTTTSLAEKSKQ